MERECILTPGGGMEQCESFPEYCYQCEYAEDCFGWLDGKGCPSELCDNCDEYLDCFPEWEYWMNLCGRGAAGRGCDGRLNPQD